MTSHSRSSGVLIVEDEGALREAMCDLVEMEGCVPHAAKDGVEALSMLRQIGAPCLVLLDLVMPNRSGWEVYDDMKASSEWSAIPIIICTSAPSRAPAGTRVMQKPIDIDKLSAVVHEHCACDPEPAPA